MEKLIAAVLLMDKALREDGYYDDSYDYRPDDISSSVNESWLRVLAVMEDLGHTPNESVQDCVSYHRECAHNTANQIERHVNMFLERRSFWERLFGSRTISSRWMRLIRRDIEEIVGLYV